MTAGVGHFIEMGRWPRVILEGVLKVAIFLSYMYLISRMKEIERVFRYHGAEHKTIACYEAGDELTVENVRKYTRFHPRCGTSFLILVVIISVFLYSVLPWSSTGLRVLLKLLLLAGGHGHQLRGPQVVRPVGQPAQPHRPAAGAVGPATDRL